jgi:pimeloyl-ACP methyl ester carboxylesterase
MSMLRRTILALTLAVLAACATPADAPAQPFSSERISVTTSGQGSDVILVPGLASSASVWTEEARRLSATHRVHVVQVKGFAGTQAEANAEGAVLVPVMEEINRYITTGRLESPAIVGHSLGGVLTMLLAEAHPESVSKIVLVDVLPFFGVLINPAATVENVTPVAVSFRDSIQNAPADQFATQQAGGVARYVRTEARRPEILNWSLTTNRDLMGRAAYEVITLDLRERIGAIQAPMLVLYAYDPVMGPQAVIDGLYAANYARAQAALLTRIDQSYHFIMIDQPDALHAALEPFLR